MSSEATISKYIQLSPEFQKAFELFLRALASTSATEESDNGKKKEKISKLTFGSVKGKFRMSDDFDAPIPGFKPYMK